MIAYVPESLADALERQEGVLSREQAIKAGLSRHAIEARLAAGRWQRLHRGVYATFSGPVPRAAVLWAAILRAGDRAVLSYHTAAETWKLSDRPTSLIHVSVPRQAGPLAISGLVVHHSSRLPQARHPVRLPPQTALEETVLDLADLAATAEDAVAWAIKACQRRLTIPERMRDTMAARSRVRWRDDLKEALTEIGEAFTRLLNCATSETWKQRTSARPPSGAHDPWLAARLPRRAICGVRRVRGTRRLGRPPRGDKAA